MKSHAPLSSGLGLLLALAACGPAPDGGGESTVAGVVELPAESVQVVGTSDALATVYDLEVLPGGEVWVLNSIAPFFVGFDSAGSVLGRHGTQGGGPTEFSLPVGFVAGGWDGEVWAFDQRRHQLVRISTPDQERAEVSLPRDDLPPGSIMGGMDLMSPAVRTARWDDRIVLPRLPADREEGVLGMVRSILKVDLVAFRPEGGEVETLVSLREALDDPFVGFEPVAGGFPLWRRLWAVCGDDVAVFDRQANRVRRFDASGTEVGSVMLPPAEPTSVTPRQFARAVFRLRQAEATGEVGGRLTAADSVRMLDEMVREVSGTGPQLAAYLPRYVDFRCTESGSIWMRPIDLDAGGLAGGRDWLKIGPDGTRRTLRMPDRFDPLRFTESRVWGVQRDAFDVVSIAWLPLP